MKSSTLALLGVLLFAFICLGKFEIEQTKAASSATPFPITLHESRPVNTHEPAEVMPPAETGRDSFRYDVTVYSADWCGPCESAKRRDGNGDDEIKLTWVNSPPPKGIRELYPTYVWTDAKGGLRFVQGTHELPKLLNVIERKRNDPPQRKRGI